MVGNKIMVGHIPWNKGKEWSEDIKKRISDTNKSKGIEPKIKFNESGNLNPRWKGEQATYRPKHAWIERILGRPDTCEHCNKSGLSGHQIHWANIDHEYRRVKEDWIRLCAKCHALYDKEKIKL